MRSRPRLLVVASTFPASADDGTPGFVRDLAMVEARTFDTMVVVPRVRRAPQEERIGSLRVRRFGYFPRRWEDLAEGAMIENLRSRPSRWLQVPAFFAAEAAAVRHAMREHRPDVVHVHWIVPQGVVALAAARTVPWLVTTLGGDVYALRSRAMQSLKSQVLRRAAAVTTMNDDMRDRLLELGSAPARTHVLPMGAATSEIRAVAAAERRDPHRVLFVGRLVEKKGLDVLLDALRLLPATLAWSLEIVGDGPLRTRAQQQAAGLPVTFSGQLGRADLARRYGRSGIVVMPSRRAASGDQDGLPVALLEAMSSGCAVIASDLPGIRDVVENGTTGVLVPAQNASDLAHALHALLVDPGRARSLGAAAGTRAEAFTVEAIGTRYVGLLEQIISPAASGR